MKNEVTSNIVDFILGGRAEFTIYQEPGTYVKYKVLGSKDGKLFRIFTNSGMEGDNSLRYQGYIFADNLCKVHRGKALDTYKNEKALKGYYGYFVILKIWIVGFMCYTIVNAVCVHVS